MPKLKIAFCDLRHRTRGLHSQLMPIQLGLLATYAQQELDAELDMRFYIDPDAYLEDMREWKPDVLAASFFCWNHRLTNLVARKTRDALGGDVLIAYGGPEIEKNPPEQEAFLNEHPYIDICVLGEGEKPFVEILRQRLDGMRIGDVPEIKGTFFMRSDGTFKDNPPADKFTTLDEIPSPYLSGLFDDFFEQSLYPMVLSSRGCPFKCTFCNMSLDIHSKVRFVSLERFDAELTYCAEKLRGNHGVSLYIGDSNFGMYPQSIPMVHAIRRHQDEYDWPRFIGMSVGKNKKERIVEASNILKWGMPVTLAAQSMNQNTLAAIERSNISIEAMHDMIEKVHNQEADTYSDIIVNLPEETKESFELGLQEMVNTKINRIFVMTLYLLSGTPMADPESIERYGFKLKYRMWPRAFGEYEGERIAEIERSVFGTNTIEPGEYMEIRKFQLILNNLYNADMFNATRRFLWEIGGDVWAWLKLASEMSASERSGKVFEHMSLYAGEARAELFDSPEAIQEFLDNDETYGELLSGSRGDNLMNKYQLLSMSDGFSDWLNLAVTSGKEIAKQADVDSDFVAAAIEDIGRYQAMMFDVAPRFDKQPTPGVKTRVNFRFDIHRWYTDPTLTLDECAEKTEYDIWFTDDKVTQMQKILGAGYDVSQTRQFVFRDRKHMAFVPSIRKTS
jgi:hypothetical protein